MSLVFKMVKVDNNTMIAKNKSNVFIKRSFKKRKQVVNEQKR